MNWLNKQLYEKENIQNTWSYEQWQEVWAQIMRTIEYATIIIEQKNIDKCNDLKKKHQMEVFYKKKLYAENEIKSWDLLKMSYKIKLLIKADLMQKKCYHSFLRKFNNLKDLDTINSTNEHFYLKENITIEPLNSYYNLNIHI